MCEVRVRAGEGGLLAGWQLAMLEAAASGRGPGAPDEEVFAAAIAEERAIVTENVPDFRRLEADALASDAPTPGLIFTTNRQFPRVIPPPSDDSFSRSMLCSPNARPVAQRTSSSRCLPPDPEAGCH